MICGLKATKYKYLLSNIETKEKCSTGLGFAAFLSIHLENLHLFGIKIAIKINHLEN
jgi:hypothetical protein